MSSAKFEIGDLVKIRYVNHFGSQLAIITDIISTGTESYFVVFLQETFEKVCVFDFDLEKLNE